MATQVILLERIESLGNMGDVVNVKPGYARNYLLPQKKALRASEANVAYFESQKKNLQAENEKRRKEAEKVAKDLEGLTVPLLRAASESGQLYGSVNSRDISEEINKTAKQKVERSMINLNQNFKYIGLFPVYVVLHPEVKVEVTVNIARSMEEAETQAKTGKAMISNDTDFSPAEPAEAEGADDSALEGVLEDSALEAEKEKKAVAEEEAKVKAEKAAKKAEEKAAKEAHAAADVEESSEETAENPEESTEDDTE